MAIAISAEPRERGIGIVRVSEEGNRAERLASYAEQEARIRSECERRNIELVDLLRERNVSGGAPLERRAFGKAITRVERGEARAIIFAHRDRADRSITEGSKAIQRMDDAGALLVAGGAVLSHVTAAQWREATLGSFMSEDYRRQIRERSMDGVATRITKANVVPFRPGPGFVRNGDGSVRVDETLAPAIREAWAMRARGETVRRCREYLAENGVERSYRAIQIMFRSPLYVGEIAKLVRDEKGRERVRSFKVCEPMIERALWDAVQATRVPSGRTAKSDMLLARLGVLRCASCGGRMVAGGQTFRYTSRKTGETSSGRYAFYRCGASDGDCSARASISAEKLEALVIERVKVICDDAKGRASHARKARDAAARAEKARAKLATAKRRMMLLPDGEDDADALVVIGELTTQLRDDEAEAQRLASLSGVEIVNVAEALDEVDPDVLPIKRQIIRGAVASITVRPGRGSVAERVSFEPLL
jgi:hypothetical protein